MTRDATPADVLEGRARWACILGDVRETLRTLPDESVQCVVTSPPYWGLRDYGVAGQIGMEPTPAEYVATMRALFAEIRRVLRADGTAWLNLGDSYASGTNGRNDVGRDIGGRGGNYGGGRPSPNRASARGAIDGLKPKDLVGIPWRVAFALQEDGWRLRSDIVWAKPNPMPESVTDRPTRAHEYVFLLTKSARYSYDAEAVREPVKEGNRGDIRAPSAHESNTDACSGDVQKERRYDVIKGANARSVWTINPQPYAGAHFATMPPELARRCILAGARKGDVVLDPFGGSGTTALVAVGHGRRALLCELNPKYAALQRERMAAVDVDFGSPIAAASAAAVDDDPRHGPLFGGAR